MKLKAKQKSTKFNHMYHTTKIKKNKKGAITHKDATKSKKMNKWSVSHTHLRIYIRLSERNEFMIFSFRFTYPTKSRIQ